MCIKLKSSAIFFSILFITILLAGCNPPSVINVTCSVNDLINAINSANANNDTTVINLDPNCTYAFTSADNNDGGHGYNALPIITTNMRINGNDALLRGSAYATPRFRFFLITAEGGLRLDEMTLYGGRTEENPDIVDSGGGAIYNDGGGLTLMQVTFEANLSQTVGGAIFNRGTVTSDQDTIFLENHAYQGGAIFSAGDVGIPMTLSHTTFRSNIAWEGGALYSENAEAQFAFYNVDFLNNESRSNGGAIYAEDGRFTLGANTFSENTAMPQNSTTPSNGGAIYILNGRFEISSTLFELNGSAESGGAIYNHNGDLTLRDEITFNSNTASLQPPAGSSGDGGAIYNETGSVDISETYFIQNNALTIQGIGTGGAIYNEGTVAIQESAFASNVAYHGGAILNHGQVMVTNASFSSNMANQNGANILNVGDLSISFATLEAGSADRGKSIFQIIGNTQIKNSILYDVAMQENCDIGGGSFQALGENIDNVGDCPGISINMNPMLGSFSDNGGFTPTFSISSTSIAFNLVTDCSTVTAAPVTQDQRGVSRPQPSGSTCDAGAFELESEGGDTTSADEQPTAAPTQEPTATPTPEPIVPMLFAPQNTTCRKGDSTEYEDAGYLLAGESAEVIGRNQEGTWLVINNPDWEGICWILRAIVETEGDVDGTKVYIPAPLPTKTPTQILGCLVQSPMIGGDPVCVVPCPDDAVPGDPCTP